MVKTKYISKVGKNYKVSEHFSLYEFASPDSDKVKYSTVAVARLEKIRAHFGGRITINSGYRSPAWNRRVKGASNSAHLTGQAVDFQVFDKTNKLVPPKEICLYLESVGWKWGIGMMNTATHMDTRYKNRMDETRRDKTGNYYFLNRYGLTFAEYFGYPKMTVNVKILNVRSGKSANSPIVRKLKHGQTVFVFGTAKDEDGKQRAKINYLKPEYVAKWLLKK